MKYAVAVADAGSINRASARLLIAQPNLSRAIKELENELGTPIFERSSRGMRLTAAGESYIGCARKLLAQMAEMEALFKSGLPPRRRFSICVPRAGYIAEAFAEFSCGLGGEPAELCYQQADALSALSLIGEGCRLAVLRYEEHAVGFFEQLLGRRGLMQEPVARFQPVLLFSRQSPLAGLPQIAVGDLSPLIELCEPRPALAEGAPPETALAETRIRLSGQDGGLGLLCRNPRCFLAGSPVPPQLLERFGLMQRPCEGLPGPWLDVLAYPEGCHLSRLEKSFVAALRRAARKYLPPA